MSSFRPGRYREPPIWSRINTPKLALHWMIYSVYHTVHIIQCIAGSSMYIARRHCTAHWTMSNITKMLQKKQTQALRCRIWHQMRSVLETRLFCFIALYNVSQAECVMSNINCYTLKVKYCTQVIWCVKPNALYFSVKCAPVHCSVSMITLHCTQLWWAWSQLCNTQLCNIAQYTIFEYRVRTVTWCRVRRC